MRRFALSAATLTLVAIAPLAATRSAQAVEYPWCATGAWAGNGGCSYTTLEQCRASIEGVGGMCVRNPRYAPDASARTSRARR